MSEALKARAAAAGVAHTYHSFWGEPLEVPTAALERVLEVIESVAHTPEPVVVTQGQAAHVDTGSGAWKLHTQPGGESVCEGAHGPAALPADLHAGYYLLSTASESTQVIVAPAQCWLPPALQQGERWWGLSAQLYALRSERNWGIGDFSDLRELVDTAAAQGAAFVGLSPLHALFAHNPDVATPYSPSSRLALNTLFIDVTAVPEFARCKAAHALVSSDAFEQQLQALRGASDVQYGAVAAAKEDVLQLLWTQFCEESERPDSARAQAFAAFTQAHASTLGRHALWEALQHHLFAADHHAWGWPAWPPELQAHDSPAVSAFAQEHAQAVQYRFWLQWLADEQLGQVQAHARQRMPLGLYCDLAVGANDGGSETWVSRTLYATGAHVGAPPDPLNTLGQNWGLPPIHPMALRGACFTPFIDTLSCAMRHAGALRMDHVMSLMRLFWHTPEGGTYVDYPLNALLAIVAVESHRHQCLVVGEDLGNVPPGMREAMLRRAMLSYRPLWFERAADGGFRPPADWQPQALAVISTHDLPTLAGYWSGHDIDTQLQLGWLPEDASRERVRQDRQQERSRLLQALEREGLLPAGMSVHAASAEGPEPALLAAVHAYLARTPCWLAAVQLEDITGQLEQMNVPGTTETQHPNWRRRLGVTVSELAALPAFADVTEAMRRERGSALPTAPAALELPDLDTADVPLATYRMQFHAGHTFAQAQAAVPYLAALGMSHLYSSPYLMARPGSTHGYDGIDPTRLNPEVGSEAEHAALCDTLASHGMGQLLDIVPNHMAVLEARNPWWEDVLEHGEASPHARTFDIEWRPAAPEMQGRVLLPVLGDHYGKVLESGELVLRFDADAGQFAVHYGEHHRMPIDPKDTPGIFAAGAAPTAHDNDGHDEVHALLAAFARLAPRDTPQAEEREARLRDAPLLRQQLADLARSHGWLREWIDSALQQLNGRAGDARSVDALDALLRRQAFRLADWRVARDDINYRRFFDVHALAALRMEDPAVFDATHQRIFEWLAQGRITGLRVDHPDGLSRPAEYFRRLHERHAAQQRTAGQAPRALYVVVEKILADHETLPEHWPVHGGTGYRFSSLVNGLFVDPAAELAFDQIYEAFTGDTESFEQTVQECRRMIIESAFTAELDWLTETLYRITRADRRLCDFTRNRLRIALVEVAAAFPVYRTYVGLDAPEPSEADRQHVAWALAAARRRLERTEAGLLQSLQSVLLGEPGAAQALRERFVERWQQFTAPVMAKAVEDTAFYRYVRLASLNDVGSEPRRFGVSVAAFHAANTQRARHRPHWLLATSTHDSKRSEDVRARLNVLSEVRVAWQQAVMQLDAIGQRFTTVVDDAPAPTPRDRWTLVQAMVGIWPAGGATLPERAVLQQRLQAYMRKAVREAKRESHWLSPNAPYEQAVDDFIQGTLALDAFVERLEAFVRDIAPHGFRNSLAQLALKMTVPGVPDIYQACEQWNFSLVDPDNRRPVDFAALAGSLQSVTPLYADGGWPSPEQWRTLMPPCPGPALKQLVTWRLLQLRRERPALFRDGAYLPLAVEGRAALHALAFARWHEGRAVVVIAARFLSDMGRHGWGDTTAAVAAAHPLLARTAQWRNWMTGDTVQVPEQGLSLQAVLGDMGPRSERLPFAVLVSEDPT